MPINILPSFMPSLIGGFWIKVNRSLLIKISILLAILIVVKVCVLPFVMERRGEMAVESMQRGMMREHRKIIERIEALRKEPTNERNLEERR